MLTDIYDFQHYQHLCMMYRSIVEMFWHILKGKYLPSFKINLLSILVCNFFIMFCMISDCIFDFAKLFFIVIILHHKEVLLPNLPICSLFFPFASVYHILAIFSIVNNYGLQLNCKQVKNHPRFFLILLIFFVVIVPIMFPTPTIVLLFLSSSIFLR